MKNSLGFLEKYNMSDTFLLSSVKVIAVLEKAKQKLIKYSLPKDTH